MVRSVVFHFLFCQNQEWELYRQIEVSHHITPPTLRQFEIYKSITNGLDIPLNFYFFSQPSCNGELQISFILPRHQMKISQWIQRFVHLPSLSLHASIYSLPVYTSTYTQIDRFYTLFCLVTLFLSSFFRALKRGKVGVVLKLTALCGIHMKIIR